MKLGFAMRPPIGWVLQFLALNSIAITMTGRPENIVILLRYFGWWPYLFLVPTTKSPG
jgi:hypothetical protein